jgi:hypothetical protein
MRELNLQDPRVKKLWEAETAKQPCSRVCVFSFASREFVASTVDWCSSLQSSEQTQGCVSGCKAEFFSSAKRAKKKDKGNN